LEIMNVDRARREFAFIRLNRVSLRIRQVVTVIIGSAVRDARFYSTARHPEAETARVMIAPVIVFRQRALRIASAAEFASPDHQGIVEHPALLEIFDQRRARLVGLTGLPA